MSTIGVIDDRDVDRQMIVDGINLGNKEEGWSIVDTVPLPILDEYPAWISQNKICALVVFSLYFCVQRKLPHLVTINVLAN